MRSLLAVPGFLREPDAALLLMGRDEPRGVLSQPGPAVDSLSHASILTRGCDKNSVGPTRYAVLVNDPLVDGYLTRPRRGAGRDQGGRHDRGTRT